MLVLVPKLRIPYPILLVLGGLVLGFMPACPRSTCRRTSSSSSCCRRFPTGPRSSPRSGTCAERPAVGMLSVGLVLPTIVTSRRRPFDRPRSAWAAAFVFGAIVSPHGPDCGDRDHASPRRAAPHRHHRRGREPGQRRHRARAYRFAVVAAASGAFSLGTWGCVRVDVAGGVAVGLLVGWVVARCGAGSTSRLPR